MILHIFHRMPLCIQGFPDNKYTHIRFVSSDTYAMIHMILKMFRILVNSKHVIRVISRDL